MQSSPVSVRAPRPLSVLWKWTGVSAVIHAVLIALFCGMSFWALQKREAALAAKEAAAKQAEAAAAAAATPAPTATPAPAESATPEAAPSATPAATATPVQAEKVLGIDGTAKPEELPSSPFSATGDDLLKDLK